MALNPMKTTTSGLSVGQVTYYFKTMLKFSTLKLVHAQFAMKSSAPKNSGKVVQFRRWIQLDTVTTPLTEATVPDGQSISEEEVTATVYQYGGYAATSDLLDLTHLDAKLTHMSMLMGDQGGRSIDEVVRDVMAATTNVQYANSKTSIYTLLTTDEFNVTEVRKGVRTLEATNTPYFTKGGDEHFVAIVDPYTKYDLQSDTLWQDVSKYSDKEQIYSGEIGRLFGVRFVQTTQAKTYANSNLIAGQKYLTTASIAGAIVTVDEAITSDEATALVGRYVNVIDATDGTTYERQLIESAAAGAAGAATVTLDAAVAGFTQADGDVMWANEYGWNGNTVRATMMFGMNAYGIIDIGGNSKNMRIIIKNANEGGPSNPLEQFSTVGWKVTAMACTILENDFILKILSGATA